MISYHPNTHEHARTSGFARGFLTADTNDVARLSRGICKYVWSACVWENGRRLEDCFLLSDWCALDFEDQDYSLKQALRDFCDCVHIIGTTRNHQLAKGGLPPIDRFRVMIPWERRITDLATFRHNMWRLSQVYPMDSKCKDGARYFFPCKDIVSSAEDGYRQEVKEAPPQKSWSPPPRGIIPSWSRLQLASLIPAGERTTTFHRVAKDLYRAGHTPEACLSLIVQSPTYLGRPDRHAMFKLEEAVRSAVKAVDREVENDRRGED